MQKTQDGYTVNWGSITLPIILETKHHGYAFNINKFRPDHPWYETWMDDGAEWLAAQAKPPTTQLVIGELETVGSKVITPYCISDPANPWNLSWESRVSADTAGQGLAYAKKQYEEHKRLHDAGIWTLIHYQMTGVYKKAPHLTHPIHRDAFRGEYPYGQDKVTNHYPIMTDKEMQDTKAWAKTKWGNL